MKTPENIIDKIKRYRSGDGAAFGGIYEESYRYLHTCVIHIVKDEDIAQDMLQETYIEIYKNLGQLKNPSDFLSWAATIANHKCFAYLKKNKELLVYEQTDEEGNEADYFGSIADDEDFIPENIFDNKEKIRLIRGIIDELSDVQRACVIGFYYNEQKQDEIAAELGIPVNTVKSHLNRAKAKIKDSVGTVEKKQGVKLYSIAPFMLLLFGYESKVYAAELTIPAMGAGLTEILSSGTTAGAKAIGSTAAKATGMALRTKIAIGAAAVVSGVVVITGINSSHNTEKETDTVNEKETDTVNEEETIDTEAVVAELLIEGLDYLHGTNGKEYNPDKALDSFKEAADMDSAEGAFLAGYVLDAVKHGEADGSEYKEAIAYYESCQDEIPYAKASISLLYKDGGGVERDKAKAEQLASDALKNIDIDALLSDKKSMYATEAQKIVASLYMYGYVDGEYNYEKALEYNEIAAQNNSAAAMCQIGYIYLNGLGVDVDYNKAYEYYMKAYDMGDRTAYHQIGWMYEKGYCLEQDYSRAMEEYTKAANLGYARSYNQIGCLYRDGLGVDVDYDKAIENFEKGMEGEDEYAYNNMAYMYEEGMGVEQDYSKAFELYERSAELDDASSVDALGWFYYFGLGVEQNDDKAAEYFIQAARLGSEAGKKHCEQMGVSWEE
ncbi:MAG: sigma-70 family RNA polymerase sigma factor [Lachnospiraceae bacterium]|nr:sigma-70 family RNA polymerase sigma factor [Lachnospiraceae bacterium]